MTQPAFVRWLAVTLLIAVGATARAEPYIAMQQGYKCAQCHVNATGGGLRTEFGDVFAENVMPADHIATPSPWLGKVADIVRVGANLRADWSYLDIPQTSKQESFDLEQLRTYADVAVIPNRLDLYADEQIAPGGAQIMEGFGRYTSADGTWYIKGGQFYLPFGWRLQDQTALLSVATGISMATPDKGVELGLELPKWSAQLDITNGFANTGTGHGHQYTGQVQHVESSWRVGLAASATQAEIGNSQMGGLFAGVRTGPVAWLAEEALVHDQATANAGPQTKLASLIEGDWAIRRGHNLKVTYEYEDPNRSIQDNRHIRGSVVYEATPIQFLQLRLGYRRDKGNPLYTGQPRALAFLELHVFL